MAIFINAKGIKRIIFIVIGTFLMAMSVNLIYEPMGMVTGGVTGIGIIINNLSEKITGFAIPVSVTNIIVNVPLFLCAVRIMGRLFVKKTLSAIVIFSVMLIIVPIGSISTKDYLLASIAGGILGGTGIGIMLAMNTSTGGTDLLGILIHKKIKQYTVAKILLVIDSTIVISGALVFGIRRACYSIIAVYITTKIADIITEGSNFAKMVYVISDKNIQIANEVFSTMNRGITGINVEGMYSQDSKKMLICVISRKELAKLSQIIAEIDIDAFVIVVDAREVLGEGFIKINNKI